jgi:hypothetical protein
MTAFVGAGHNRSRAAILPSTVVILSAAKDLRRPILACEILRCNQDDKYCADSCAGE